VQITVVNQPDVTITESSTLINQISSNNNQTNSSSNNNDNLLKPTNSIFNHFLKRESIQSRRESLLIPGLMRSNLPTNSSSFFMSFQSKDFSSLT
jgi:hypothetical protein